jgi:uncharacterized coiled-coil protein SlyX
MKFALVNNIKTEATKGAKGICPNCGYELIAKCGFVNKPDLEQRVSDLENRVALIEETLSETDTFDTSDKVPKYRENWRQLREGMSQDQVQELLGRPNRIDGGRISIWHYSTEGRVYFSRGKVDRWSEPY